jgi:membrane associated rhomboid family serine protease
MASALYIGSFLTTTPGFKPARLVTLIVGSALTGSSGWLFQQWLKAEEGKPNRNYGLGFSGVVMGMSVVASLLDPLRKVPIYGIIPVPLWALSAGYLVYDSFFLNKKSNVGHAGHLGGMAFGFLYYFASIRRGVFIPTRV